MFGPTPGCVISRQACGCCSAARCTATSSPPICWFNVASSPSKSSRRHAAQGFNGSSRNNFCPAWLHSLALRCIPLLRERCCVRFSPGCESPPDCADATPTAAGRAVPGPESTNGESGLPPRASKCGLRPAYPYSACAPFGKLRTGSAGPDLRCISNPDRMPQVFHQFDEPLAIARGLHADQSWCRQLLVKNPGIAERVSGFQGEHSRRSDGASRWAMDREGRAFFRTGHLDGANPYGKCPIGRSRRHGSSSIYRALMFDKNSLLALVLLSLSISNSIASTGESGFSTLRRTQMRERSSFGISNSSLRVPER